MVACCLTVSRRGVRRRGLPLAAGELSFFTLSPKPRPLVLLLNTNPSGAPEKRHGEARSARTKPGEGSFHALLPARVEPSPPGTDEMRQAGWLGRKVRVLEAAVVVVFNSVRVCVWSSSCRGAQLMQH